jgi:2-isopropylmalate synthase
MTEQVKIFDTTLRDGEQTPGVNFDRDDKLQIAERLAELGVDIIEAGSPFSGDEDSAVVREIAESIGEGANGPIICALARLDESTKHSDIENARDALGPARRWGRDRIHTYIGTSPWQMRKLHLDEEGVISGIRSGVKLAKEFTDDVEFSPEDASRTSFKFMMRAVLEAVDAGATTINIPDTVGKAQPTEYARRIRRAKREIDARFGEDMVTVSAHCHDDLGNATANTIAAVASGGARQVEVALGSLGERAGNASLEQVVANLREAYPKKFHTNIKTPRLTPVVREVMSMADIVIPPNTPIVGPNAFAHEAGTHQAGVRRERSTYEYLQAEDYGQQGGEMVIAKLSGKAGFSERIIALGINLDSDQLQAASKAAKDFGATHKRELTDIDIEKIVQEDILGVKLKDRFVVEEIDIHAQTKRNAATGDYEEEDAASITIRDTSLNRTVTQDIGRNIERGTAPSGPINAAVIAVNDALGIRGDITAWNAGSKERGSYATGGISLGVRKTEIDEDREILTNSVTSHAEGKDVVAATIIGYVRGLNLLERMAVRGVQPQPIRR